MEERLQGILVFFCRVKGVFALAKDANCATSGLKDAFNTANLPDVTVYELFADDHRHRNVLGIDKWDMEETVVKPKTEYYHT